MINDTGFYIDIWQDSPCRYCYKHNCVVLLQNRVFLTYTGYAEEAKVMAIPLPKYYIVIVDEEKISLIQLDLNFEQKAMETVLIHEITTLRITGVMNKKVLIQTPSKTIKVLIKPMAIGIKEEQQQLIDTFTRMAS